MYTSQQKPPTPRDVDRCNRRKKTEKEDEKMARNKKEKGKRKRQCNTIGER
jgi:hypothetical protein